MDYLGPILRDKVTLKNIISRLDYSLGTENNHRKEKDLFGLINVSRRLVVYFDN